MEPEKITRGLLIAVVVLVLVGVTFGAEAALICIQIGFVIFLFGVFWVLPGSKQAAKPEDRAEALSKVGVQSPTQRQASGSGALELSDPPPPLTEEVRRSIHDHVQRSNDLAVERALAAGEAAANHVGPSDHGEKSRLTSPPAALPPVLPSTSDAEGTNLQTQDIALRRALSNLAEISRAQRADRRAQIQREVAAIERRGLPIDEVIAEIERIARQAPTL